MDGEERPPYAVVGKYTQRTMRDRIEAFFLDNVGRIASREQIIEVATDPRTGKVPENWHQRVSELRTNKGCTILTQGNRGCLKVSEYLMPDSTKRKSAGARVRPTVTTWAAVLKLHDYKCAWSAGGDTCGLKRGDVDPVGGGRVLPTPDHKRPHSVDAMADKADATAWRPLCSRRQVMKKNYRDDSTGWLNVYGIAQAASVKHKRKVYGFLREYFKE